MRIVIAPDSFKGTLSAAHAADAIAAGVRQTWPEAECVCVPLADGGEGTAGVIVQARGGDWREARVTGPLGEPIDARFGMLNDGLAVIEMAAAAGLTLVPSGQRQPMRASTFGVGELVAAAVHTGARGVYVGVGGSATTDGGAGCAQALGVRFYDRSGELLDRPLGGGDLDRIARIDTSATYPALTTTPVTVLADVTNPLIGPRGAARTYGPQKGATPDEVVRLDANLKRWADLIHRDIGADVADLPGGGAAGGLAAGLHALAGAQIVRGARAVCDWVGLRDQCMSADAVITGEGCFDGQSLAGKVASAVGEVGRDCGIPVFVLAGQVRETGLDHAGVPLAGVASVGTSTPVSADDAAAHLRQAAARHAATWLSAAL